MPATVADPAGVITYRTTLKRSASPGPLSQTAIRLFQDNAPSVARLNRRAGHPATADPGQDGSAVPQREPGAAGDDGCPMGVTAPGSAPLASCVLPSPDSTAGPACYQPGCSASPQQDAGPAFGVRPIHLIGIPW